MLISVVIPTRHRNDSLATCLSRLAPGVQTLTAELYEVIVTDDGSTSTAEAMVRDQFPWARWTAGPRRGPAANRNHGASLATGEWVVFTDDDCVPSRQWLKAYADAAEPGIRVMEGRTTCEAGVTSPMFHAPVNLTGGCLWTCNLMTTCHLFSEVGGFDERFRQAHMEDVDLRDRLVLISEPVKFVHAAVVDHPPRRTLWGSRRAALHESEVIYFRKYAVPFTATGHCMRIARVRLNDIRRHPRTWATLAALASLGAEMFSTVIAFPRWLKLYPTAVSGQSINVARRCPNDIGKGQRL